MTACRKVSTQSDKKGKIMMFDLLIKNGKYPDFDKRDFTEADVAVKDGKIAAIFPKNGSGKSEGGEAAEAKKVIDANDRIVTPGFIDMHMHEEQFHNGSRDYDISILLAKQGVTTGIAGNCGICWRRTSEFRQIVEDKGGCPINYALLSGYNSWREAEGLGWYDPCPEDIRKRIVDKIRDDLENGAFGFSFGLEYGPGIATEEMTKAALELKEYDPFISIHFRADCEECMNSLKEMADLSRDTGCRVEISHIGSLAATAGNMKKSLDYVRKEIAENPKLGYDVYPYNAFCTILQSAAFDMDWRAKWGVDYDIILLLQDPYTGQRCTEELYNKLLKESEDTYCVAFAMNEEEVKMALKEPCGLFGSDGDVAPGNDIHPRAAGCYPRILGKYVREEKLLPLIDALDKMTRRAAARVGLTGKGEIKTGMDADLVIFDPDTIIDGAEYTDTSKPNKGIDYVVVAGEPVIDHNEFTGSLKGSILDRKDYMD